MVCALVDGEEKAEIGTVRLEQRQTAKVVGAVARNDAHPGIEEVVALLDEAAVVRGQDLGRLGGGALEGAAVHTVQENGERTLAEEMAMHLQLGHGVAELLDHGAGALVNEHLFWPRVGGHVVHHRDAPVVKMTLARPKIPAHAIVRDALPFQAGNELARERIQILEQVRERLARRFLHGQDFDHRAADIEVGPVALHGRVRDEVVQMRVVLQGGAGDGRRCVVHEAPKESERVAFREARRPEALRELHLERSGGVMEASDGAIEIVLQERHDGARRQPVAQSRSRLRPEARQTRTRRVPRLQAFVDQHEIQLDVIELGAAGIEVGGAALDGVVDHRLATDRRRHRLNPSFAQVLIDAEGAHRAAATRLRTGARALAAASDPTPRSPSPRCDRPDRHVPPS